MNNAKYINELNKRFNVTFVKTDLTELMAESASGIAKYATDLFNNIIGLSIQRHNLKDISFICSIKSITKSLTHLNLYRNQVDINPIRNFQKLKYLNISWNKISDISPLENLTNLTNLNLASNYITNLTPLTNLIKITNLNLYWNEFSDIKPISKLPEIIELNLNRNNIPDILPLKKNTKLQKLDFKGILITSFSSFFDYFGYIQYLESIFGISAIKTNIDQIVQNRNIQEEQILYSVNNQDRIIGLSINKLNIENLQFLNAKNNIEATLTHLNLYDNKISDLSNIGKCKSLIYLCLNKNKINNISPLKNLKKLITLDLYENEIADIENLEYLSQLSEFDIRQNKVKNLLPLRSLNTLKSINIDINNLNDASINFFIEKFGYIKYLETLFNTDAEKIELTELEQDEYFYGKILFADNKQGEIVGLVIKGLELESLQFIDTNKRLYETLIYLNLQYNNISEITHISKFRKLTHLVLNSNKIKDISQFVNLKNLIILNLDENEITDIENLENLNQLTELNLKQNKVKNLLPLRNLNSLKSVDIDINNLNDASINFFIEKFGYIRYLEVLFYTNAKKIELTEIEEGEYYYENISYAVNKQNKIVGLVIKERLIDNLQFLYKNIDYLKTLTHLYLPRNEIKFISLLSKFTQLTHLDLSYNEIIDISPIKNFANLEYLNISNNKISEISQLMNLQNLVKLNLSNNKVEEISALNKMKKLKLLLLNDNQIRDIQPLSGLLQLIILDISKNQIKEILSLSNLSQIQELNLNDNQIVSIQGISSLNNVTKLTLQKNKIQDISLLKHLRKILELDLSNNKISYIQSLSFLSEITDLNLSKNVINDISPLKNLSQITFLNLKYNLIVNINSLSPLTRITNLNLCSNRISDISSLKSLSSLTNLDLSNNNISDIQILSFLNKIEYINLNNNSIIDISSFRNLEITGRIDLSNNPVKNISILSKFLNSAHIILEGISQNSFEDEMFFKKVYQKSSENNTKYCYGREYNFNESIDKTKKNTNTPNSGILLHCIPNKMQLNNLHLCFIRIAFDEEIIIRDLLDIEDIVLKKEIRTSRKMEVILLPSRYFEIEPLNDTEQIIEPFGYTEWCFDVRPNALGKFPLTFRVSVLFPDGRKGAVLKETVTVDTESVQSAQEFIPAQLNKIIKTEIMETIKILFLSANPTDQSRIQSDKEHRIIKSEMQRGKFRDNYEFLPPQFAVTITELLRAFNDKPNIIHFSGHGEDNSILITTDNNETQQVSTPVLIRLFKPLKGIANVVFLNSCYSSEQAREISNFDIFVIGMNLPIEDEASISFAKGLYNGLGEGKQFEDAYNDAMIVLMTESPANVGVVEVWKNGEKIDL